MERILPTDPPDEPVNRIAPFLEKLEAAGEKPLPLGIPTLEDALKVIQEGLSAFPQLMQEFTQSETTQQAWAQCLNIPGLWSKYKSMLRQLLQSGSTLHWKLCLEAAEEPMKHLTAPDPELDAIIAEAKRKLAESGQE